MGLLPVLDANLGSLLDTLSDSGIRSLGAKPTESLFRDFAWRPARVGEQLLRLPRPARREEPALLSAYVLKSNPVSHGVYFLSVAREKCEHIATDLQSLQSSDQRPESTLGQFAAGR
jgi:hypothetical protein